MALSPETQAKLDERARLERERRPTFDKPLRDFEADAKDLGDNRSVQEAHARIFEACKVIEANLKIPSIVRERIRAAEAEEKRRAELEAARVTNAEQMRTKRREDAKKARGLK